MFSLLLASLFLALLLALLLRVCYLLVFPPPQRPSRRNIFHFKSSPSLLQPPIVAKVT